MGKLRVRNSPPPPPTLKTAYKLLSPPPPFKGWKLVVPPLVWLRFQALVLKLPQNLLCPPPNPISMGKTFSAPSLLFFVELKLDLPPPPYRFIFTPTPPPLVIYDRSLRGLLTEILRHFNVWPSVLGVELSSHLTLLVWFGAGVVSQK